MLNRALNSVVRSDRNNRVESYGFLPIIAAAVPLIAGLLGKKKKKASGPSKAQLAAEAKAKEAEEKAKSTKNVMLYGGLGVGVLMIGGLMVFALTRGKK